MMKVGFVGASAGKLTPAQSEEIAGDIALFILIHSKWHEEKIIVVSGGSPKGGTDSFAETIAERYNMPTEIFRPHKDHEHWQCDDSLCYGYKARNIDIARSVDILYAFASKHDTTYCYHCKLDAHIPSGGCFTLKKARELGKDAHLILK